MRLTHRRPSTSQRLRSRLFVRSLEERTVPAMFVVNANTDTNTADPMDPLKGDLRYCIDQANLTPGADTITFDPSVTQVFLAGTELVISDDLTITGNGLLVTEINGSGLSRILRIDNSATTAINVAISDLTLANGSANGTLVGDRGGAIQIADESVTINNVRFQGNQAASVRGAGLNLSGAGVVIINNSQFINNSTGIGGGGVHVAAGSMTINNSVFSGNSAAGRGAGLYVGGGVTTVNSSKFDSSSGVGNRSAQGGAINVNTGLLNLNDSTVTGNSTTSRGGGMYMIAGGVANVVNTKFDASSGSGNLSATQGGAIAINGSQLTMTGSTVSGNTSTSRGGGMYVFVGGVARIDKSTFSNNLATGNDGGAIAGFTLATITVTDSTLTGNTTAASAGDGGAIYANRTNLTVERSLISNNSAGRDGGGIGVVPVGSNTLTSIRNSTVTGNRAGRNGGGIASYINYGIIRVQNSTIVSNTAVGSGGGVSRTAFQAGQMIFDSNILANNGAATNVDLNGTVTGNNNIFKNPIGGPIVGTGNITGVDPDLGLLTNNGGFTNSFKPNPGSPAINAGLNAPEAQSTDQTGATRSYGQTDIGAVEVVDLATPRATPTNLASLTTLGGSFYGFAITYSGSVAINPATIGNANVRVTGPNGFDSLAKLRDTTGSGTTITATYVIAAPGGLWDNVDTGTYTVSIEANQVADTGGAFVPGGAIGQFNLDAPRTIVVTNTDNAGPGSLRQAVLDAGFSMTPDTITFDPSLSGSTITLSSLITINTPMSIVGPGADKLTISGNKATRIFTINGPGQIAVNLSDLTLANGSATTTLTGDRGAAINITDESVSLTGMVLTGNSTGARGGAIAISGQNGPGVLNITKSTIQNNTTTTGGGGVFIGNATATITESTIANNTTTGTSQGGGVFFDIAAATTPSLLIDRVTINGNTAGSGGGITILSGATTTTTNLSAVPAIIRNSTISGNRATAATGGGGGIHLQAFGNNFQLQNSTLAFNTATGSIGGGGIAWSTSTASATPGTVTIESTIISNNSAGVGPDVRTAVGLMTANSSLIFDLAAQNVIENGPVIGDPLLLPLANNGGPTQTHALTAGSPAIDFGSNTINLTVDQRGLSRVVNLPDVGAYEFNPQQVAIKAAPVITPGGNLYTFTVEFTESTGIDISTIDAGDITVNAPNLSVIPVTLVGVNPAGNGHTRTATFSFVPPGGAWDNTNTGSYSVTFTGSVSTTLGVPLTNGATETFRVIYGQVITVTNLDDSGSGSLRQAIADSFLNGPAIDTITFDSSLTGTITLTSAALEITRSMVIQGTGASKITISGNNAFRVFTISDNDTSVIEVTISGVTIANGSSAVDGGGIFLSNEKLTLESVNITNNTTDFDGGGIAVGAGGILTVRSSTISGNTALAANGYGGGIYFTNGGDLDLENSTVTGNRAGAGGGIYVFGQAVDGTFTIRNSTISGNSSNLNGGGVLALGLTGQLLIQNSTIVNNTTGVGFGGGVNQFSGTGSIVLQSSIVANNVNANAPDVAGRVVANFSLISNTTLATITGGSNRLNVDPLLQPLANNGGATATHRPAAGSPVINFGYNAGGQVNDQRGGTRTVGITDIGSVETNPVAITSVVINNGAAQRSMVTSLKINFSTPATFADISTAFSLVRVSDSASVTLNVVLDPSGLFATITFTGGAVEGPPANRSLADGRYTLTMSGSAITNVDGFDADGDGIAGGNFTFGSTPYVNPSTPATGIFRLAGDGTGNGIVEADDFLAFRLAFLSPSTVFDFDGINNVDPADFLRFRLNFLKSV